MSGAWKGFLITAGIWVLLTLSYVGLELAVGRVPFGPFDLSGNGKFIVFTVLAVVALGTGVGFASDRIRAKQKR